MTLAVRVFMVVERTGTLFLCVVECGVGEDVVIHVPRRVRGHSKQKELVMMKRVSSFT